MYLEILSLPDYPSLNDLYISWVKDISSWIVIAQKIFFKMLMLILAAKFLVFVFDHFYESWQHSSSSQGNLWHMRFEGKNFNNFFSIIGFQIDRNYVCKIWSLLVFSASVHWVAKKWFKIWAFCLKYIINLFLWKIAECMLFSCCSWKFLEVTSKF